MDEKIYCLRTNARREAVAAASLTSFGIYSLAPRVETLKKTPYKTDRVIRPMFPGYIFARLNLDYFFTLGNINGVHSLVRFSNYIPPVEDEFIEELTVRMDRAGIVRLDDGYEISRPEFLPGDRVVIDDGPFDGYCGIFQSYNDSDNRVKILLESLYGSTLQPILQIPREYVSRAAVQFD